MRNGRDGRPYRIVRAPFFLWSLLVAPVTAVPLLLDQGRASEPLAPEPLTPNVPIEKFQNPSDFVPSYDFNAPPEGIFRSIQFTEGFEEELGFRRTHEIVPVNPTNTFSPDSPAVYIVFQVYPHYNPFQVFGVCYPEQVEGLNPQKVIAQDTMYLALEDETGYLKLFPPDGGWKPGKYKVQIHIGFEVNDISLVGTMRFDVVAHDPSMARSGT